MTAPLLSIRNASVVAGDGARILDRIDVRVAEGEHTAVLGPNGSGKSSLIRLITLQNRPFGGDPDATVEVFGRERWDVFELRRLLGIVSAELSHSFTRDGRPTRVLDVVVSGFLASREPFAHHEITAAMVAGARAALDLMEVPHLSESPITHLSTGEMRRVLIARALAPDPRALLLDEPTTGLDLVARRRFLETLRAVARAGKTLVLVTHHVEEVLPEIGRVVLLREGRIFRDGPKAEVLTSAALAGAYDAPMEVRAGANGYYTAAVGEREG